MPNDSLAVLALLVLIGYTSHRGHQSADFRDRWIFDVERIRLRREYYRFVTCCGLHADLKHFVFNAVTILAFGGAIAATGGALWMLTVFFGAVATGSLLSFWFHRREHYLSLGASGGGCGLIFAYILMFPRGAVSLGLIPLYVPGWIYAILFVVGSYIAHRRKKDNIGHLAHLGGAAGGILLAGLRAPHLLVSAPLTTWIAVAVLLAVCAYLAFWRHGFAKSELTAGAKAHRGNLRYQRYDEVSPEIRDRRRLDALLDKISQSGTDSLGTAERHELEILSARLRPTARSSR